MNWDSYFHTVCEAVASKSPCLSRKIGAILVHDKSIISTGYNGPARGYPHCKGAANILVSTDTPMEDIKKITSAGPGEVVKLTNKPPKILTLPSICPRRTSGYASGEGLEHCPASHAEMNCVANAARIGASTVGSTLYMNSIIPCKFCMVILVNAGVIKCVVDDAIPYHEMSIDIASHGDIRIRRFQL